MNNNYNSNGFNNNNSNRARTDPKGVKSKAQFL